MVYKSVKTSSPDYFFNNKDLSNKEEKAFSMNELFKVSSLGSLTKRDKLAIDFNKENLKNKISYFLDKIEFSRNSL